MITLLCAKGGRLRRVDSVARAPNRITAVICFRVQAAIDKKIEDNPAIALKSLITSREEEEERQEIQLSFGQSTYCHHRAIREIWRNLEDSKKRELVVCKNTVHPVFSTSFGLHVAVLTADTPQKFIFARRANRGVYQFILSSTSKAKVC